jgi:hypothetical protein
MYKILHLATGEFVKLPTCYEKVDLQEIMLDPMWVFVKVNDKIGISRREPRLSNYYFHNAISKCQFELVEVPDV